MMASAEVVAWTTAHSYFIGKVADADSAAGFRLSFLLLQP
jgi:hypothetical protein